jgi:renalase
MAPRKALAQVGIVGAGIAGLAARRFLRNRGISSVMFEKSRGAGGRMATRRLDDQVFDLGAQFTSAPSQNWAAVLEQSMHELTSVTLPGERIHPRYTHRRGMSAIARGLLSADASDVRFSQKIIKLSLGHGEIEILTDSGLSTLTNWVLLTAPVPQSLALLENSALNLSAAQLQELRNVKYEPCLTVIATLPQQSGLVKPGILPMPAPGLAGIYDQGLKGVATGKPTLVVHATAERSLALWDLPAEKIMEQIWAEAIQYLGSLALPAPEATLSLHRWRYSQPCNPFPALHFPLERIVLAGDGFGTASVSGAFASGESAAEFIAQQLQR